MGESSENLVDFCQARASILIDQGLDEVYAGNHQLALEKFRQSLKLKETLEGYTYSGWMFNSMGDAESAIKECEKAINLDPESGDPYNDIGSYLLQKGELNAAIRWFYKAIDAPKYESRHFPHVNLGKLYLAKKLYRKALYHMHQALELDPGNRQLEFMILELEEKIN